MSVEKEQFGLMPDGRSAFLFTLENRNSMKVQVTNYGAKLVSAWVLDRYGRFDNVILGYPSLDSYLKGHPYLGATVGRVANRIGNATFIMDGNTYQLSKNHSNHHLHGGEIGFDSVLWEVAGFQSGDAPWVEFVLISPDGEQGYPGNLEVRVRYSLLLNNTIHIDFTVTADKPTIVNMTNHAYFNLNGSTSEDIYKHIVRFFASRYLKTDKDLIPTGELANVEGTPLDFRKSKEIGQGINLEVEPIVSTSGYDQFLIIDEYSKGRLNLMAEVFEPSSGRVLQVTSTLPGMQFYTSNFLDSVFPVNQGKVYGKHSSFCIEPSYFPDAPNHPSFDSIRLNPDETYKESIAFRFLTK